MFLKPSYELSTNISINDSKEIAHTVLIEQNI